MDSPQHGRRSFLRHFAAGTTAAVLSITAHALDRPTGAVILTVTGLLEQRNDGSAATFDIALFNKLPQHSFTTATPWFDAPHKFSGVLVSDLLKSLGSRGVALKAVALDDYRVDIPVDDLVRNGAMIASQLDDKALKVREKGPLWLIYPFDDRPETRTTIHYSRSIWQLKRLELQ